MDRYQLQTAETAIYPGAGDPDSMFGLIYTTLGLVSEAGEIAGKVKKIMRDDGLEITEEHRAAIRPELGDVLWYTARLAEQIKSWLSDVAAGNLEKLADRLARGKLSGSGDDR